MDYTQGLIILKYKKTATYSGHIDTQKKEHNILYVCQLCIIITNNACWHGFDNVVRCFDKWSGITAAAADVAASMRKLWPESYLLD